jgi:hypothetical protein
MKMPSSYYQFLRSKGAPASSLPSPPQGPDRP